MNRGNIIVLIFLIVPLVLLIVSYSSYWYKVRDADDSSNYTAFKSTEIKSHSDRATVTNDWKDLGNDENYKNTLNIYKAALSFAVIAWIVDVVAVLFVVLSLLGILSKIPIPLGFVTKLLPVAVFVLCAVSLFIFVGLPSAMMKDCKNVNIDSFCEDNDQLKKLVGSNDNIKWGPIEGWACVVVSAAFSLGAAIIAFSSGSF